jgi:hypothetical protein
MGVVAKESHVFAPSRLFDRTTANTAIRCLPSTFYATIAFEVLVRTVKMMYSILFKLVSGGELLLRTSTGCRC